MRVRVLTLVLVLCVAISTAATAQTGSGKFTALTEAGGGKLNGNIIINFFGTNPAEAITAYQFGVVNVTSDGGGGGAVGKVTFSDLTFIKPVTPLSVELFNDCATGKHIPSVTIEVSE